MKILLIEDEVLLANSVKSLLERKGFQVEVVHDGESVEICSGVTAGERFYYAYYDTPELSTTVR